ncbi:DUF6443 domain-containing protein, partial [Flavobacterium restrictum]
MKKILFFLVLFPILVLGQTQTENYIKTKTYKVPTATSIGTPTISQASQNVTYFDGLGRPIQQIAHQQSGTGNDLVTPITYDGFGRQEIEYLPYVPTTAASLDYKSTALTDVMNFAPYSGQNPLSKKLFESSPLNRVLKQAAPGADWAMGLGHEIKLDYQTNVANEVKQFAVTTTWNATSGIFDIALIDNGTYLASQLYKTVTYDENTAATPSEANGSTVEFKNKEGQVVLKRTYDNLIKHDTYYVYDQYGNLTYVLPPLVTAPATQLDDLAYQYKYDARNRLVEKKLPGKQWEYIVYDKLDRVVATGPAFSPFSDTAAGVVGWMITKYDVFNRPVYTGWEQATTVTSTGRATKQTTINGLATISESKTTTATTIDAIAGVAYYSNAVVPTTFKLLTVNYYDDYAFFSFSPAISYTTPVAYNNSTLKPKGLPTGSWVRVLTTQASTTAESSCILYDAKARPVRTFATNYLGGYTQIDSNLEPFSGRLNYTETRHKRLSTDTELYTKDSYTYTAQDRIATHTHQIGTGTPQLLAANTYDELGQLIAKKVGGTDVTGATGLQKVDYTYNIRGWLTGINDINNLNQGTDPKDLFGFKINYNKVEGDATKANKLYNGNIAETYWSSGSDGVGTIRAYGYKYDNLNRLKDATYQKPGNANPVPKSYDENLTYDKNGNILSLLRNGDLDGALPPNKIDNLVYTYASSSNKLLSVLDSNNNTSGFKDGNTTGDDYTYDSNGNMISDKNKNITAIVYNHLNLPTKITFATKGTVDFYNIIYNALGQKVAKVVTKYIGRGSAVTTTDYLQGYQYSNTRTDYGPVAAKLQFFPTAEGYVDCSSGNFNYIYNYTDHLGNVRVSYEKDATTGSLKIIDENNYYPFGLKHSGYNPIAPTPSYKYRYNSKEFQDELSLNLYDYGAR